MRIKVLTVGFGMRRLRNITILVAFASSMLLFVRHSAALLAWAQSQATAPNGLTALRIVSPKNGERIQQSFVTVRYAPLQQTASPTFELQLDAQDPVHTTETSYTFKGLTPGLHDLIIQAVDANNTPIPGTRSQVRFVVIPAAGSIRPSVEGQNMLRPATEHQNPIAAKDIVVLPDGRSSLPLLSVIGFGILVGGVISALRTRPTPNR